MGLNQFYKKMKISLNNNREMPQIDKELCYNNEKLIK